MITIKILVFGVPFGDSYVIETYDSRIEINLNHIYSERVKLLVMTAQVNYVFDRTLFVLSVAVLLM